MTLEHGGIGLAGELAPPSVAAGLRVEWVGPNAVGDDTGAFKQNPLVRAWTSWTLRSGCLATRSVRLRMANATPEGN
jgi:hypothetical protein